MYGQMPAGRGQETEIFPACAAHARMLGLPAKLAPREFYSSIGVVAVVYKPCPTTICPLTTRQRRRIIWRASSDPSASKGSRRSTTGLWARPFPSGAAEQTSTLEKFCSAADCRVREALLQLLPYQRNIRWRNQNQRDKPNMLRKTLILLLVSLEMLLGTPFHATVNILYDFLLEIRRDLSVCTPETVS